ncbi:MAG TPA: MATE family efflux transporter [Rhizomicrobium sp.]|jgi:MATE family multidrug resistance protein|nr:MATE family efflux transporter [Rhizomicrobium sp.]
MTDIAEFDPATAGARVAGHGSHAWIAEIRELLKLSLPLIATQLLQMAIGTTDTLMLARFSNTALAGAVLGNTMFYFCWLLGSGPTSAVSPMIAHLLGADPNAKDDVRVVARMGFWSVLMVGLPLVLFLQLAHPILLALGQSEQLASAAARFVVPLSFGLPFSLGFQVLRNYSTALSKPRASLIVMVFSVFFNAAFDYALIFGHFGFPKLGLMGSGIASACSFACSFLLMLAVVRLTPKLHLYRIFRDARTPDWGKLREIYVLGLPIGLTMLFEACLFFSSNFFMGHFGLDYLAGHTIAMNVPSITFMVPLGIAMAATVRVGLAAGAGDREAARRAGMSAIGVATAFMTLTSAILWIWPFEIATLYLPPTPANMHALLLAVAFLHVAAVFQIVDGIQVAAALALRGLKDARAPMWIAGASYWLAGFPACMFFAFGLGLNGLGIWYGLAFALTVAAALMCWRFWWMSRRV